jgi:CRISPR-associated protein Csm2
MSAKINDASYCDQAEKVMQSLGMPDRRDPSRLTFKLTTSKIRNLLSQVNEIYNDVIFWDREELDKKHTSRIAYLRVRMVYEAGRDRSVRDFLEKSQLLDMLGEIRGSKEKFLLFSRYFEALVAYHRFLGGVD